MHGPNTNFLSVCGQFSPQGRNGSVWNCPFFACNVDPSNNKCYIAEYVSAVFTFVLLDWSTTGCRYWRFWLGSVQSHSKCALISCSLGHFVPLNHCCRPMMQNTEQSLPPMLRAIRLKEWIINIERCDCSQVGWLISYWFLSNVLDYLEI